MTTRKTTLFKNRIWLEWRWNHPERYESALKRPHSVYRSSVMYVFGPVAYVRLLKR